MTQQNRYTTYTRVVRMIQDALAAFHISHQPHCSYPVLTPQMILDKSITLDATPTTPGAVLVDVLGGGGPARYGVDFTVTGNVLSWSGLGMDGHVSAGDTLRIFFLP